MGLRKLVLIASAILSSSSAFAVTSKTFTPTGGFSMLAVNSERHKPHSEGLATFGMQLEAGVGSRWQIHLATMSTFDETFSGTKVGATYLFGNRYYELGDPTRSGYGASTRTFPKWRSQLSAAIGRWRYSGKLISTTTQIARLQSVPVKADLYGMTFGYHLYRLISEDFYATCELSSTQAMAPGFSVSVLSTLFGVAWWL